jgi:hypothetical protein
VLKGSGVAGGKIMKNELAASLRKIGDTVVAAEQAAIMSTTIKGLKGSSRSGYERHLRGGKGRGHGQGVRRHIAGAVMRRNRMTDGKNNTAGIEIRVSASKMPLGMGKIPFNANLGIWRHPVFGDRKTWASQRVTPAHWWTKTMKEQTPRVRQEFIETIVRFNQRAISELGG